MSRIHRSVIQSLIFVMAFAGAATQVAAQDGETGIVRVTKYYCTYLDQTLLLEAIEADQCSPGAATLTFYRVGDGTADYEQLVLDESGDGSITLPAGSYEMVEEGAQAHFPLTVSAGQTTRLLVGNPAEDPSPQPTTGTITLQHYLCTYLDDTLLVEAIDQNECVPAATTFSFYLYGDGTDAFQQASVGASGHGSIELAAGTYDMVEERSQTHFNVTVLGGESFVVLVAGPRPVTPAPTAVPTQAPAPAKPATGTQRATKLPSTGAGVAESSNTAVIVAAGAVALAAAGGAVALRQRERAH